MSDEYTTFRAAHRSVLDAIAACERPDWLVLLAWEVADHKTAVSIGLGAAKLSSTASDLPWFFNPNPDRLETVAAWTGDDGEIERSSALGRAIALAGFPAVALAYGVVSAAVPNAWTAKYVLSLVGAIIVLEIVFALVVRRSLAAIVRRRAAQLDDRAALEIVLDEIRKGDPRLVPIVLKSTGGRLRRVLNAGESQ